MNIKNIVFDFGGVVVGYDPAAYLRGLYGGTRAEGYIMDELFGSEYWRQLDLGRVTREEANAHILERAVSDGFGSEMRYVQEHWFGDMMGTKADTVQLVKRLRERGYGVYYLTNMPGDLWERFGERGLPGLFMGGVASFEEHMTKPDGRIYRRLLEKCGLEAARTVFLDDTQRNIDGARAAGIAGILFTGAAIAASELERMGVNV